MKTFTVIGNWKMYKTAREATGYLEELIPQVEGSPVNIYLAVPYTSIASAAHYAKETNVVIGAQNMNDAREGAFTGEIAGLMLKEAGACFVLLGHSERRHVFGESDDLIHRKVIRALADDIQPVLCVGETAKERALGKAKQVIEEQITSALNGVPKEDASRLMIAYEPVWAIGTGKTATPDQIQEAHAFCRECLLGLFGKKIGSLIPILYGGSVKLENVSEIGAQKDVDGVLVGGASLDPKAFSAIVVNITNSEVEKKPKKSLKPRKPSKPKTKKEKKE